jgi:signal transduction histidine kinase
MVITIVTTHILLMRPGQRVFEQKLQEAEYVASVIEGQVLAEMLAGAPDNIEHHVEFLQRLEGVHRVEIIDTSMTVRASTYKPRVGARVDRQEDLPCRVCHAEGTDPPELVVYEQEGMGRIVAIDHVLYNKPECRKCHDTGGPILGNVLVELSLLDGDLEALAVRNRLIVVGGILLVVMFIGMGVTIRFLVGRPAADLLAKINRIEEGDFDMEATRRSNDEFGYLETGIVKMVDRLRELYSGMEAVIEERTKTLYETQAQVIHQEKLAGIGQLAAGVAHEIGNPLTAIDSLAQLLELEIESDDTSIREKVSIIQAQVGRISEIVHNMADLSRPLSLVNQRVNVVTVLQSVIRLVKYDARFQKIEITTDCAEDLPHIITIEDRLFGVFLNLALNAADAMPDGGRLEISARVEGDDIVIDFRDSGHGIAQNHLEKIFDAYFTTKEAGRGTGLGLTVCKTFFQNQGGNIEVESEVGKGSLFRVRVPVVSTINQGGAT